MRLSTRLLLPLLATVAAVMGLYGAWALRQRQITLVAEAQQETQAYATALGLALEYAFRDRDLADVQDIIDRISREPKIYAVLVYDTAGTLLFLSDPLQRAAVAPATVLRHVARTGRMAALERQIGNRHVYSVLRPIANPRGKIVGVYEVAQPLAFVQAEQARTTRRFLWNTLTLLAAVTIVILWLVRRLISRPLERLLTAARALGRGELAHRVGEDSTGRELVELGREFNRMAERLEAARAELVREAEERIALERRLRETEKLAAIGNLAAGLAHEIGAPLNVIGGRAELLLRRDLTPEARERNLRIIVEQIGRITAIVRNVLDFARRREPRLQPLDLALVLDGVLEFLDAELARAAIRVERDGPRPAWTRGDPHLLHQVFVNLLMNAIHALETTEDDDRRIAIRIRRERGRPARWAITVQDNGPGIPEDARPHIFEPFFTTKAAGQGTGLGLAVARSIAEEHDGRLELAPTPDAPAGRPGATFVLTLPAIPTPEPAHA